MSTEEKIPWQTKSQEVVLDTGFYQIRRDEVITPSGTDGVYHVIVNKPSVFIVPVDPEGKIVLIRQYRYPTQMLSWEIPAGGSEEEGIFEAAKRELWEETGCSAQEWVKLPDMQAYNGASSQMAHVYYATGLYQTGQDEKEEDGIVEYQSFTWEEVIKMIESGEFSDGQSIAALWKVKLYLEGKE